MIKNLNDYQMYVCLIIGIVILVVGIWILITSKRKEGFLAFEVGALGPAMPIYNRCVQQCDKADPSEMLNNSPAACDRYCYSMVQRELIDKERNKPCPFEPSRLDMCEKVCTPKNIDPKLPMGIAERRCRAECMSEGELDTWCRQDCMYSGEPENVCMSNCMRNRRGQYAMNLDGYTFRTP